MQFVYKSECSICLFYSITDIISILTAMRVRTHKRWKGIQHQHNQSTPSLSKQWKTGQRCSFISPQICTEMANYSQGTVLLFHKQTPTQPCMDPLALRCGEPALKQLLAVVYNTRHDTYLRIGPTKYVHLLLCCSHLFLASLGITDGSRCFAAAGFKALGQTVLDCM